MQLSHHNIQNKSFTHNSIQDELFGDCSRMEVAKSPLHKLSHICYNDETWHSYTLPKEDPKNI